MAHFSVWQRSPFRNSFMPSRRQCRQTGPMYLAKSNLQVRGQRPGAGGQSIVGAVYGVILTITAFVLLLFRAGPWPLAPVLLYAALLRRPAAVVRDRCFVPDVSNFKASRRERSDGRLAACAWTA